MFEKESEFYAREKYSPKADSFIVAVADDAFKDGANFGYNKANEWHYVKDGDLPKDNTQVLVLLENKRMKISIFMEKKFTVWNKDYDTYTKLYNVVAWKEIVPPKESD